MGSKGRGRDMTYDPLHPLSGKTFPGAPYYSLKPPHANPANGNKNLAAAIITTELTKILQINIFYNQLEARAI